MKVKLALQVLGLLAADYVLLFYHGKYDNKSVRKYLHERSDKLWYEMDRKQLNNILHRFHVSGFIDLKDRDTLQKVGLTQKGRRHFLKQQFKTLKLPVSKKWDKKWRMVAFDVPESNKKGREALRNKLKKLGFKEFQKSLFAYPYHCQDEVNFVINFFDIAEHVYYFVTQISPDIKLRQHFELD